MYGLIHLVYLFITYLATLFKIDNFSAKTFPLRTLLENWNRWDTGHFTTIATHGYDAPWRTAFFPLYPLLERGLSFIVQDPYIAGLVIANLANFGALALLYKLVEEDFDQERAARTILYLSLYPAAFFLSAAYNESLFLLCVLGCFYCFRRGNWWLAGLCGLLASLTRSAGVLLVIPFCYEYLRQRQFQWRKMLSFDILSIALIPLGVVIFAAYCWFQFHDPLTFSHAQSVWGRQLRIPPLGFLSSLKLIWHLPILSFTSMHNVIDLGAGLVILALVVLGFVGPWKFRQQTIVYALYGATAYLFVIFFPSHDSEPLQSQMRLVMETFPAFMILAAMGKEQKLHQAYVIISNALMIFFLLQFLTGFWMV
ncbi:mannosyltransferase family protein [Ktedonobacter sp. SOSP1-85]|uniref:mannosyltransferase family protein n=1 Tax=Ktedonobacter sp. SOSP1-85 TaxID=2778367 RepID=UPI0019155F97|nr:mannosyltransferase family protein [Ktedonobacter sp. SOSP1-85]